MLLPSAAAADFRGGSFRAWPHGARELAMAGSAGLLAPGLEAISLQPASLVGLDAWELGAALERPVDGLDLTRSSFAAGWGSGHRAAALSERTPASRYAAALAWQQLDAELADGSGWGEWTFCAAGAWSPRRWFSLGLRASYARGGSDDGLDEGRALSVSAGLRVLLLRPGLEFGWLAEDLHQRYSQVGGREQRRAAAQTLALAYRLPWRLSAELSGRWRSGELERSALGLEWVAWQERLFLRGGFLSFRLGESRISPSAGFGVALGSLRLDYGVRFDAEEGPGSRQRLSLLWRGGGSS